MTSRDYIARKAQVISAAVDELATGYDCTGPGSVAACVELPEEEAVLGVLALLDDVFFPGYRSPIARGQNAESLSIERLDEVYDILFREIRRALPFRWLCEAARQAPHLAPAPMDSAGVAREADRIVGHFFSRLSGIRNQLLLDVVAAYNGDPAALSFSEVILNYPGMRAITKHRVAHELYLLGVPLIPRMISEYIHANTGIEIHPGAKIGESFFIDHGTGVVIGETAEIGNRVKIYQGVTLGAFSIKTDEDGNAVKGGKRHPTIEDDVVIYSGATILGGSTVIGQGATIGANTWISRSVPPGETVTLKTLGKL